jgi:hypothetical protein
MLKMAGIRSDCTKSGWMRRPPRPLRALGKRVSAMVSGLSASARDGFVGPEDRAAGQTAAVPAGRMPGDLPTTVGVVLESNACVCAAAGSRGGHAGVGAPVFCSFGTYTRFNLPSL